MTSPDGYLQRDDVMLLFTTSPAGLGHVRVTEALRSGVPENVRSEVLGIKDNGIQFLHRISSTNRVLRQIVEFVQNSPGFEGVFTGVYRNLLRRRTGKVYARIVELVKRRRPKPNVLIIISTHFGLAHKIAKTKRRLAKKLNICVVLCVVVTDDSSQKIWAVKGADFIFVPSETTKTELVDYMKSQKMLPPEFVVSPYPVSVKFEHSLTPEQFGFRSQQLQPNIKHRIKIVIPISGAAVQLKFFMDLITYLDRKKAADIMVVSRESKFTGDFLSWCESMTSVAVIADILDKDVVSSYEKELVKDFFSLEITKPSEQAFKALLTPRQAGGVILLFSKPVGRQEYDNIDFLTRHGLLPDSGDQRILQKLYDNNESVEIDSGFLKRARNWRGMILPMDGSDAAKAILRLKRTGVLASMVNFENYLDHMELRGNGVQVFWKKLGNLVSEKCEKA